MNYSILQSANELLVVRAGDLQVVNMVGSDAVQALVCQSVLYPRALLRCAALREVALFPYGYGAPQYHLVPSSIKER